MECLVTGDAGFIGSNLVDALVERGDRVTVIDNLSTGKRENLAGALQNGAVLHTTTFAPERPGEASRSCLDISRAKGELGLEARVQLGDGLRAILARLW